jgi:predicted flap endonuclease-1-like 5' DNA nuclease
MLQEGETQGGVGVYVWVFLGLFFVMVFLGWLAASRGWLKKEAEPTQAEHAHDLHAIESAEAEPVHATQAAVAQDDLTSLEGIGPKVAKVLAGIGITTFDGLARADYAHLKTSLDAAGYKYMDPAGWIDQARFAAKGDMVGLKKLQDTLKGGRKTTQV